MEKATELAATAYWGVFKEPRGFIRILEFFLAIFAFATTTSHNSQSSFDVQCGEPSTTVSVELPFSYPYRLTQTAQFDVPVCKNASFPSTPTSPCCDFNSPAEFYVFVGVMAFLYTLAITVYYVLFDEKYRSNENIPTADFVYTCVFALLWLISSSAWADGVSHLKEYIDPNELFLERVPECAGNDPDCTVTSAGNFANLNVSLILGFLNTFVWGGNCWFLFKESRWFKRGGADAQANMQGPPAQEQQHI
jgi:hypothetical protein